MRKIYKYTWTVDENDDNSMVGKVNRIGFRMAEANGISECLVNIL